MVELKIQSPLFQVKLLSYAWELKIRAIEGGTRGTDDVQRSTALCLQENYN